MPDKRLAVIGVGNMGAPMAGRLLDAGYELTVHDLDHARVAALARRGAAVAGSPREAAGRADALLLSLPTIQALEAVVLGTDGILDADVAGRTVIDTTTATMTVAAALAERLRRRGARLLDSPVTGGVSGAEQGTLSIMVGGDRDAFDRHQDVYRVLGRTIVHVGASGHGQVSKLVNQMLMAAIYCSVAEAFAFASQLGVDIARVYDAVEHGGARSALLSGMRQAVLSGSRTSGGNLAQHGKDVGYAMDEASRHHSFVPVTAAVHEVWKLARLRGLSDLAARDMGALWEELLGKSLHEPGAAPRDL